MLYREYLKPLGYRKIRRTFSREHEKYIERYQLQGSAWNNAALPWTFYLNCGISFIGLPRRVPDKGFPHTHASMRASYFTDLAPPQLNVTAENMALTVKNVHESIDEVSQFFMRRCECLRESYEYGRFFHGFLEDAELKERLVRFFAPESTQ